MHRAPRMIQGHSSSALERSVIDCFRWLGRGHPAYARGERREAISVIDGVLPGGIVDAHFADALTVVGEFWAIGVQPFEPPHAAALSRRELLILDAMSALQGTDVGQAIEHLVEVTNDGRVVGVLFALRVMATRLRQAGLDVMVPGRRAFTVIEGKRGATPPTASEKRAQRAVLRAV